MKNVLYAGDGNFYAQLYVSVWSLCASQSSRDYVIHVIAKDFSPSQRERLAAMVGKFGQRIAFYDSPKLPERLVVTYRRSEATYYRICAGGILPADVHRVLYIDADTVVEGPLDGAFEFDLAGKWMAGVQDAMKLRFLEEIGLSRGERYVNAGVLLIDMDAWRREGLEQRFIAYLEENGYELANNDQDVINHVCRGNIAILPLRYNVITPFYEFTAGQIVRLTGNDVFYPEEERRDGVARPCVIHYAGNQYDRPWNRVCDHPARDRFWKYARESGVGIAPMSCGITAAERIKRILHRHLPFELFLRLKRLQGRDGA